MHSFSRAAQFESGNLLIGGANLMSSLLTFYNHATLLAAHAVAQKTETTQVTPEEMSAGEFEDGRMYDYKGLVFFPAYNELWNPSTKGYRRVTFQYHQGKPRWMARRTPLAASYDRPCIS